MKKPGSDQVFDFINITILLILIVIMAYPIYFVLIASVSDPTYVNSGQFLLWPKGFSLLGYRKVFEDNRIWIGYFNTLICDRWLYPGSHDYHDGRFCLIQKGTSLPGIFHGVFRFYHVFRRRPDPLLYGNEDASPDQYQNADGSDQCSFGL